jgi:ABC-type nitrate/sulfonate/bicarbonate transport system substrate-binding protein
VTKSATSHFIVGTLLATFVASACSGAASPSPAANPTDAPATEPATTDAPTAEPGALPTPELTELSIGAGITEMGQYPGILAAQAGIYEKYGITVDYSVFEGDGRVAQALQAGQLDVGFGSVSAALSSQLTDIPFVIAGLFALKSSDDLVCQNGLDSTDDVRGKTIAISSFGGVSHGAALLLLRELDLSPVDAVITVVGGQGSRIAALQGGSVDCAIVDLVRRDEMTGLGFTIAATLENSTQQYGISGILFREDFIERYPNTAQVVVAANLEAQNMIWLDPDAVVPLYAEFSEQDEEAAEIQVQDWLQLGNRSLLWEDEAFINPQKTIAAVNPDIIEIEITEAGNPSFLQALIDNGFYEKIGNPVP